MGLIQSLAYAANKTSGSVGFMLGNERRTKVIKVENIKVYNIARAVYSARNAMNSWDKSDSDLDNDILGHNDLDLARRLYKAGTEHRKYLRSIFVSIDITAPLYWISEFDTYKIGTTRNSCSFMHKGVSEPFKITDFSIYDDKVYEILSPIQKENHKLKYKYETTEFKIYTTHNGRNYKIYRNGKVVSEKFEYTDSMNRHRVFEEKECIPSVTKSGYFSLKIGGRNGEKWLLHRLIATVFLDNPDNLYTVNHIDGDKGNNCVENLEWCSLVDNIKKGFEDGLFENGKSLHAKYRKWKRGHIVVNPFIKSQMLMDYRRGLTCGELAKKYDVTPSQANNIVCQKTTEHQETFELCYTWENTIECLNKLRIIYLETKDNDVFQQIRCLLPSGYNQKFTITMNYENVFNIIHQRSGHKLDEWKEFCEVLKGLPYVKEIMEED